MAYYVPSTPLYALARTRFRSRRSIIHPPRIPPETPSAFHTPLVYHEAPPTMLLRLYILGGEVGVTVAPVTAILTTALTTTRVATITPGAHIASVPTDTTTTVPVPITPHIATTRARLLCGITTHHPWESAFSVSSVSGVATT
ncbi:hypothetical protein BGY98DRAFT_1093181 [Russula aff. rugulosa BPL654]|nr:hypothetical protein BGY98DRAFT_1093181 [Russula aff. rugulosa BPL654]